MLSLLPLVLSLASLQPQPPDAKSAWLREHTVRIASIDPDHEDWTDLQPMKHLIGDARVVQLGEQSHGDGAVFLAKCRLVKFLHEEMGFDVLVWESGVFDCREADRAVRDAEATEPAHMAAWKNGVFGIWALSAQAQPVIEYSRQTAGGPRPLELSGYDCQFSSGDVERWVARMEAFLKPMGEEHPSRPILAAIRERAAVLDGSGTDAAAAEGVIQGLQNLAGLTDASQTSLVTAHGADEAEFMRRTIDDAIATARMTHANIVIRAGGEAHRNHRDQRMGENLIWLANERYKGRKLIVWAATMHQVHDVQAIRPAFRPDMYKGAAAAGTVAHRALGNDLYTIGFEAHDGSAGTCFGQARAIGPSPEGSLGAMLAALDAPFLLLDFRSLPGGHWARGPLLMRPLGYASMETAWADQLDAVFFIRTMFPSTQRGRVPAGATVTASPAAR